MKICQNSNGWARSTTVSAAGPSPQIVITRKTGLDCPGKLLTVVLALCLLGPASRALYAQGAPVPANSVSRGVCLGTTSTATSLSDVLLTPVPGLQIIYSPLIPIPRLDANGNASHAATRAVAGLAFSPTASFSNLGDGETGGGRAVLATRPSGPSGSPGGTTGGGAASPSGRRSSVQFSNNFGGLGVAGAVYPPDTDIAVGFGAIGEVTNDSVAFYDTTGVPLTDFRTSRTLIVNLLQWFQPSVNQVVGFFGSSNVLNPQVVFNPHILYDQFNDHWIMTALLGSPGTRTFGFDPNLTGYSRLLIATSPGSDPTNPGMWHYFVSDLQQDGPNTNTSNYANFHSISVDSQALYATVNEYSSDGKRFLYSKIRIFNLRDLYNAGGFTPSLQPSVYAFDFWGANLIDPASGLPAFSIQPCRNLDQGFFGAARSTPQYLVDTITAGSQNALTIWSITNPIAWSLTGSTTGGTTGGTTTAGTTTGGTTTAGTTTTTGTTGSTTGVAPTLNVVTVGSIPYGAPPPATQPGTTAAIDTGDARILSAAFRSGNNPGTGTIMLAHSTRAVVGGTGVSGIHWTTINTNGFSRMEDSIYTGAPGEFYYLPAIASDINNNLYLVFNRSSSTESPSLCVTAKGSDWPLNTLPPPQTLQTGFGTWSKFRFGDYNGIAEDPNNGSIWVGGEYIAGPDVFGTWIGNLTLSTQSQFAGANLSSPGTLESWAAGIVNGSPVGYSSAANNGSVLHAIYWPTQLKPSVDLTPTGTGLSRILAGSGQNLVGDTTIGGFRHAAIFNKATAKMTDLNPGTLVTSTAAGASGSQQVGYGFAMGGDYRALLWSGSAGTMIDLTPAQYLRAYAFASSGAQQAGGGVTTDGRVHPLLWTGSSKNVVDLLPKGFVGAYATAISGASQVGYGWQILDATNPSNPTFTHALLWAGNATSAIDLNPAQYNGSQALGVGGGLQVGYVFSSLVTAGYAHAAVWSGSAASVVDLHRLLPAQFVASWASGVDTTGNIVGVGVTASGQHVGVTWTPIP